MCFRTKLNSKIIEIEKAFEAKFSEPESYRPKNEINGFEFPATPVVINESPGEILSYNWGLIPLWSKTDQLKKSTLNARIETLEEKPAFRNSLPNRCLIIVNGFYEWQWLDEKGKNKQKYLITSTEESIFALAGIYSNWREPATGKQINSYSIVTTRANELMSEIHNRKQRMPVVLRHQDQTAWLNGAPHHNFAFPYEVNLKAQKL